MTKEDYNLKYTYGLDGQESLPLVKAIALLNDLAERGCGVKEDLDSDTVGLAIIGAGTGFVRITIGHDADDIVHLPAVADIEVGHVVRGSVGATGCEIRVHPDDDAVVYLNNDKTTHREAALPTNCSFQATLVRPLYWVLLFFAIDGTPSAPTPD